MLWFALVVWTFFFFWCELLPHCGLVMPYGNRFNIGSGNGLLPDSHYLNQCWLLISEVLWQSPEDNELSDVFVNTSSSNGLVSDGIKKIVLRTADLSSIRHRWTCRKEILLKIQHFQSMKMWSRPNKFNTTGDNSLWPGYKVWLHWNGSTLAQLMSCCLMANADLSPKVFCGIKARYGGSNMKKINNGGRLLIFYMMEGIKKVNWKNGILRLFSVTDPPKIQDGRQI